MSGRRAAASPSATTESDVDAHSEAFAEIAAELAG